jgi:hypothetical protein
MQHAVRFIRIDRIKTAVLILFKTNVVKDEEFSFRAEESRAELERIYGKVAPSSSTTHDHGDGKPHNH